MILELNGTKVTIIDKTLGYQGDNLINTIQVTVDKESTWNYKLDMYKGKSKCFDSVLMTREGNVCTVQLTNEILSYGGRYIFQLRGYTDTQTYHSDIFESWVNASIEYQDDCKQVDCGCDCKLPIEFYQVEDNVTEINNHPPYPGDNGKWMIWDVNKHEYVESDIDVIDVSDGTLYVVWTEDNGKITADHTIAEIREAYNSNKAIIGVIYADVIKTYQFVALDKIDSQEVVFSYTTYIERDLSRIRNIVVAGTDENGQDVWIIQGTQKDFTEYQLKAYMDSSVTSESNPEHYPSTKAVYDFVTENANNFIVNVTLSTNDDNLTLSGDKTYDEIKSALDDNRNVVAIVKLSDKMISYAYASAINFVSNKILFYEIADGEHFLGYVVSSLNQWTYANIKFITEHDVTTTMASPSDNLIPTSKAVQSSLDDKLDKTAVVDVTTDAKKGQAADAKSVYDTIQALPTGTDISLGITSAAVGDIVKVKAVDENGKPTEWEAGGGNETWADAVPYTTLEEDVSVITHNIGNAKKVLLYGKWRGNYADDSLTAGSKRVFVVPSADIQGDYVALLPIYLRSSNMYSFAAMLDVASGILTGWSWDSGSGKAATTAVKYLNVDENIVMDTIIAISFSSARDGDPNVLIKAGSSYGIKVVV